MATLTLDAIPKQMTIGEASVISLPPDQIKTLVIDVVSGTIKINTRSSTMTDSPEYTSESRMPIIIEARGSLWVEPQGEGDAVIVVQTFL